MKLVRERHGKVSALVPMPDSFVQDKRHQKQSRKTLDPLQVTGIKETGPRDEDVAWGQSPSRPAYADPEHHEDVRQMGATHPERPDPLAHAHGLGVTLRFQISRALLRIPGACL